MKNQSHNSIFSYGIAGFIFGLLLNLTGALFNYYIGFRGSLFHFFNYSPFNVIIIFSPIYLSVFLGLIGLRKGKSTTFDRVGKIIAQINEAIIITDLNRAVQWVNGGFVNIHGYSLKEIKGKKISEILQCPHSDKDIGESMLAKLLKGEAVVGELLINHKNGSPVWISTSIKPIFDKQGNIEGYVAINKNISSRKEKELSIDSLYKEIADYKFALDQSSSIIIFDLDGKILKANNNFCIKNELAESKIAGQNLRSINSSMSDCNIAKPIWNAINEGLTYKGELITHTTNDKVYWAYTTIVPILDEKGKPLHFLLIEKDITKRKLLEIQLQINKNKLQMAMQIVLLGSWDIDLNGVLTLSEEIRKIYHLPLLGPITIEEIYKNIPVEDIKMIEEKLDFTRSTFQKIELEFRYIIDDQLHYMSSSNTAQFNQAGDFTGVFGTVQDITVTKLTELALKKSEEEKAMAMQIALLGSWEIDLNGIITLSDELRTIIKEPLNSPIDLAYLFERISGEEVKMIEKNLASTRATFQRNDMEFQFLVHGEVHYLTTTNIATFNKEGEFTGLFGTVQDVTVTKLAELALKKSEEEKAIAMQIALLGSWEIDINGALILSKELKTLIKEPLEAKIDLTYVFERMLPEEVIIMQNNLTSTSTTFQKNNMGFQYLVHGETRYFTATNTAQFNKEGDFTGLFGTVQDVTALKLIEIALKKSEEEKAIILNNTQTILCIHEIDGTLIYINTAAENILGFTNEEIKGLNIQQFTHKDDMELLDKYRDEANKNNIVSGQIHIIKRTGEKRLCLFQNTIYANNGNTPYVIASAIDITDSIAVK